ncbi:MAG: T9SS type A sorting domain-containing protein [Bacteroidia bacterium]
MAKRVYTLFFSLFLSICSFSQVYWEQMGTDIIGENDGDRCGWATSISADGYTIAVSATVHNNARGHVKIYTWDGTGWIQKGTEIEGEAATDGSGVAISISNDGNLAAIGARSNDGYGPSSGHVRIYEWNGSAWIQKGQDIDGKSSYEESGRAVSISGDGTTVAIGSPDDTNISDPGTARVYRWDGSTSWVQLGVDILGEANGNLFGTALSLSDDGNVLAVGANRNNTNGAWSGHVRVFDWNGTSWMQRGTDIYGLFQGDEFGFSVSISADGNTFAAGAPLSEYGEGTEGRVRLYTWNGSSWVSLADGVLGEYSWEQFGYSVSISDDGNRFIGGGPREENSTPLPGRIEVNQWDGTQWNQIASDYKGALDGEWFGHSVGLSANGKIFVSGAPFYILPSDATEPGRAQVYRLCGENPPVADEATLPDIVEECEVTSLTAPTATDDCDHSIIGTHDATLPITTVGTTTVTWTYTDLAGNVTNQTQDVIISPCPVGIVENETNNIKLYPNPTFGWLSISTTEAVDIELSNLSGQILLTQTNISGNHQLDLTSYAQGMYLLKVHNATSNKIYRVVKE